MSVFSNIKKTFKYMINEPALFFPPIVLLLITSIILYYSVLSNISILRFPLNFSRPKISIRTLYLLSFFIITVKLFVNYLAGSFIALMVNDIENKGRVDIGASVREIFSKIAYIFTISILLSLIITIGFVMFVIPGILATVFFVFSLQEVVLDSKGPLEAIKSSFVLVKSNFLDVLLYWLSFFAIGMLSYSILGFIPHIGPFIAVVFNTVLINAGFTIAYLDFKRRLV